MEDLSDDPRNPSQVAYDAMADQIRANSENLDRLGTLVERLIEHEGRGNIQTVYHKTEGAGGLLVGAIVACFATWVAIILVFMQLHDLTAWRDIHAAKISKLEARP